MAAVARTFSCRTWTMMILIMLLTRSAVVGSFILPVATLPLPPSRNFLPFLRQQHELPSLPTQQVSQPPKGRSAFRLSLRLNVVCAADLMSNTSSISSTTVLDDSIASMKDTESFNDSPLEQAEDRSSLLDVLSSWFQGDFDNYRQVVDDRDANLLPREGGGHEHIHCVLIPVTATSRLAAFYFDGQPGAIFRFRFYRLTVPVAPIVPVQQSDGTDNDDASIKSTASTDNDEYVDTLLYTLDTDLEVKLRACTDSMQWPRLFVEHVVMQQQQQNTKRAAESARENDMAHLAVQLGCVTLLPKCEVRWSWKLDPVQHAYALEVCNSAIATSSSATASSSKSSSTILDSQGIHAVMVHGEALLDSQMMPGSKILIRDQLSLWSGELWIHDRGFSPDTMAYIYGNQRGIPYRMQRVTEIHDKEPGNADGTTNDEWYRTRHVTDPDLAWTLGSPYRSPTEYDDKMQRIGGKSTRG